MKNSIIDKSSKIIYDNKMYTNKQICTYINMFRKFICEEHIDDNIEIVVFTGNRFIDLMIILSVFSTNLLYVPIEYDMPSERVKVVLESLKKPVVITDKSVMNVLDGYKMYFWKDILKYKEMSFETEERTISWGEKDAYTIFTSGSTGTPKGVCVSKKAVLNFISGTKNKLKLDKYNTILAATSFAFDISLFETIVALSCGMTVVLASNYEKNNGRLLINLIKNNKIEILQVTPSRLHMLFALGNYENDFLTGVKMLVIGGDKFPRNLLQRLMNLSDCEIYNAYGPTESTGWISYNKVIDDDIQIGDLIDNVGICLVDEEKNIIQKENTKGELCIWGSSLANGYINFNNDSFFWSDEINEKLYKTGDICYCKNGKYYIIGRNDNMIKINGYRIELEEIEENILSVEGVSECIVLCEENKVGLKKLKCFLKVTHDFEMKRLKNLLKDRLPLYMIPKKYYVCTDFSHTISGKIDRSKFISKEKGDMYL